MLTRALDLPLALSLCLCASCNGGGDALEVKAPFPAYTPSAKTAFAVKLPDGTSETITGGVVGQKEIGGKTFHTFQLGPFDAKRGGVRVQGRIPDKDHLEVAEAEIESRTATALGLPSTAVGVLDQPVSFPINPPVGAPQPITLAGTGTWGKPGEAGYKQEKGTIAGTLTLAATGVAVDGAMGSIGGCNHYQVAGNTTLLGGTPTEVAGEIWYHPSLGLVKAKLTKPLDTLEAALSSTADATDLGDGWASVHKMAVVGGSASSFRLDTYEVKKQFDADKDTHAKMLVEIRWKDEAAAKTDKKPFVGSLGEPEFGTVMGVFPAALQDSTVSFFHPDENGKGYHHWIAFVDQAAKNEPSNGIAYHIAVSYDPGFSPIRVTARIIYKKVAP